MSWFFLVFHQSPVFFYYNTLFLLTYNLPLFTRFGWDTHINLVIPGLLVFAFQQKTEEFKQGCPVPVFAGSPSRGAGVSLQRGAWVQDPGHRAAGSLARGAAAVCGKGSKVGGRDKRRETGSCPLQFWSWNLRRRKKLHFLEVSKLGSWDVLPLGKPTCFKHHHVLYKGGPGCHFSSLCCSTVQSRVFFSAFKHFLAFKHFPAL